MASFGFLVLPLMMVAFMVFPPPSLSSEMKLESSATISAAPALLPDPSQELSPDVAPLLPSPGGDAPSSSGSNDIPTIPSNPSVPNPDEVLSFGPGSAVSPTGSELNSGASFTIFSGFLNFVTLTLSLLFW